MSLHPITRHEPTSRHHRLRVHPAHLWCFKSQGHRDAANFSKDLVKGYKVMAVLQLWQHIKAPDASKAQAPTESAAACRDVGMATMHSEIHDSSRNLLVTFSPAVNGASNISWLGTAQNQVGSTLLWEKERGKAEIFVEESDRLPPVLTDSNRY